jgi:hypothetical protein
MRLHGSSAAALANSIQNSAFYSSFKTTQEMACRMSQLTFKDRLAAGRKMITESLDIMQAHMG